MKTSFRLASAIVAAALLWTPAVADPKEPKAVTITGHVSVTPASGAADVAVYVKTAPAADKKILAKDIKGTVVIVTLAPAVAVKLNGNIAAIDDLRAGDKVTVTVTGRNGTTAPNRYVASRFIASSGATNYAMTLTGVIAVAPAENATTVMVFVRSFSANTFYPAVDLRNATVPMSLAAGGTVVRNGVASTLAGLKLDDRIVATISQRTGTTAPFTYVASRIVATAANSDQPVTVSGSITATPATGATSVSVYVKNVSKDVGWANDTLKGTTILVGLSTGGTVSRNGEPTTLAALRLDDRITMTLVSRTGTAAPYLYLASRITATPFTSLPFTVSGSVVSIQDAGATRVIVYVKNVMENDDHNAFANDLKGEAIVVSLATGGTVTRNGVIITLGNLQFNEQVSVTIADRAGTAEPYTFLASKVAA